MKCESGHEYKRFLHAIADAVTNNYEVRLRKEIAKNPNLVVWGFDNRLPEILLACQKNGWVVSHVCLPSHIELNLDNNAQKIIRLDGLLSLPKNNTTVLVCGDAFVTGALLNLLHRHGFRDTFTFPPIERLRDFEHKILSNLPMLWEAYRLLEDELSRDTFLSVIRYKITGDISALSVAYFPQYYHYRVKPEPGDVIIDGGAFDGSTGIDFLKAVGSDAKIIGFEPNRENFLSASRLIGECGVADKYLLQHAGLGACEGTAHINGQGSGSFLSETAHSGGETSRVMSIDEYSQGSMEKIHLIKLDVEGYEMAALQGAHNTIAKYSPKLQVCVYHKLEDLWELPLYIQRISQGYKFFMAHHAIRGDSNKCLPTAQRLVVQEYAFSELITCWETVLYCRHQ